MSLFSPAAVEVEDERDKYNDGVNHHHLFPLTKVAQCLVDYKSGTFKNVCSFQFVICSVAMDLTQLDNPAKLLKLMQQFGDDADNADKEIDAVISICLESGLESTILDDFKLLLKLASAMKRPTKPKTTPQCIDARPPTDVKSR